MLVSGQHGPSCLDKPRKGQGWYLQGATVSPYSWPGAKGLSQQEMLRLQGPLWDGSNWAGKAKRPESTGSAPSEGYEVQPAARRTQEAGDHWAPRAVLPAAAPPGGSSSESSGWCERTGCKVHRERLTLRAPRDSCRSGRWSSSPAIHQPYQIAGSYFNSLSLGY